MKRIFAIILSLVMVISLCACDENEPASGTQIENDSTETPTEEFTETPTEAPTLLPTEAPTQTPVENKPLIEGVVDGSVYENHYFGIGFRAPEDMSVYTEDEIRALNGYTEGMTDIEYTFSLLEMGLYYDMMAVGPDNANVSVNVEFTNAFNPAHESTETYAKSMGPSTQRAMSIMGMDYSYEDITVTIEDQEYLAVKGLISAEGKNIYQYIVCFECDKYVFYTVITMNTEEDLDRLLACFYHLA